MQDNKLYVGNLNYAVTEEDLKKEFIEFGEILSLKIIEGRGFGFVEFTNAEQANAAMEALNGKDFNGRTLKINIAKPQNKTNKFKDKGFRNRNDRFDNNNRNDRYRDNRKDY